MFEQVASLKNMMSRIKAERSENDSLSEQELMELQSQRRDPKEKKLEQVRSEYMDFRSHPLAQKIDAFRTLSKTFGIENPFFRVHGFSPPYDSDSCTRVMVKRYRMPSG